MGLKVSNLTKKYGEKTVVDSLSFEMKQPGVYALLGTNGAGKTTTIRMMLGMLARDGGEVLWDGKALDTSTCNAGYLAEERGLYPKYTLMDQLLYFAALRGISGAEAKRRIRYWAERLEVEEYLYPGNSRAGDGAADAENGGRGAAGEGRGAAAENGGRGAAGEGRSAAAENGGRGAAGEGRGADAENGGRNTAKQGRNAIRAGGLFGAKQKRAKPKLADQLSKGNQQKIQFMIALLSDPELLILDEPLSGLDPVNTDLFKSVIREEIGKGKYLIMSSHQMATVEEFCTDLTILHRGEAVLQGNLNEIKKSLGRVNLMLKTEQDILPYIRACNITLLSEKENEYQLRVTGEEQANELLAALIADRVRIIVFELREPSLHEIFVSQVGEHTAV